MITYAHKDEPTGTRFRQFADTPLPDWAVDPIRNAAFDAAVKAGE